MRKLLIALAPVAALVAVPATVQAENPYLPGPADGPMTGAIVGPEGNTEGTVVVDIPPPVRTYVIEQDVPSVVVEQEVVVGEPLPQEVTLYPVEGYQTYAYTVVNHRHVIIDPRTRTVIAFAD